MNNLTPTKDSVWQYVGPQAPNVPIGQLHLVVYSKLSEVITIGIPFGNGGTWLGPANLFREHFVFKYQQP